MANGIEAVTRTGPVDSWPPPPPPRWLVLFGWVCLGLWLLQMTGSGVEAVVNRALGPGRAACRQLTPETPPVLLVEGVLAGDRSALERFVARFDGRGLSVALASEHWVPWLAGTFLLFLQGAWLLAPANVARFKRRARAGWKRLGGVLPSLRPGRRLRGLCRVTGGVLILGLPLWIGGFVLGLAPWGPPVWAAAVLLALWGGRPWGGREIGNSTLEDAPAEREGPQSGGLWVLVLGLVLSVGVVGLERSAELQRGLLETRTRALVEGALGRGGVGVSLAPGGGALHGLVAVEGLTPGERETVRLLVTRGLDLRATRGDTLEIVATTPGWPGRLVQAGWALIAVLALAAVLPARCVRWLGPHRVCLGWAQAQFAARGWIAVALLGSLATRDLALQAPVLVALAARLGWRIGELLRAESSGNRGPGGTLARELAVDRVRLEIGCGLASLAARDGPGSLPWCLRRVRRALAENLGLVLPLVRVRRSQGLAPGEWRMLLGELEVGRGVVHAHRLLARFLGSHQRPVRLRGARWHGSGQAGVWILPEQSQEARQSGYQLLLPAEVMAGGMLAVLERHAGRLLGLQDTALLAERCRQTHPAVIDAVWERMSLGELHAVLAGLLEERVSIRDLVLILETLVVTEASTRDARLEEVRRVLAPVFIPRLTRGAGILRALVVSRRSAERLIRGEVLLPLRRVASEGGVLLVPASARRAVREQVKTRAPEIPVLSYEETRGVAVQILREL